MSKVFTLLPHQGEMRNFLMDNKRAALFSFMGSGKTGVCLSVIQDLSLIETVFPVLIIAPIRVAASTWPNEIAKWDNFKAVRVSVITDTLKKRETALNTVADIYTTNYESLPWLVDKLGNKWPFKTVIVDESTRLKGFRTRQGSKRAKALAKVSHTLVSRMILLTGTPAPNGLLDLWGQMWFLDQGKRLGKSFSAFCDKWFYPDASGYNWLPVRHAQDEIQNSIKDLCLTVKAEDWHALEAPVVNKMFLDLPSKAAALYADMEKKMFAELEETDFEAVSEASKTMKCRQIAAGALYQEDGTWSEIHDEKINALESIIAESGGMPVIVAYHFRHDLERLTRAFPAGRVLDSNPSVEKAWNNGEIPVLFIHPTSAGMGLNLQDGGNILVFFSLDWRMEDHVQVIERIGPMRQKQSGHKRSVFIHYLIMRGTIDETIFERIDTKKSVQEILLDAMNTYKSRGLS